MPKVVEFKKEVSALKKSVAAALTEKCGGAPDKYQPLANTLVTEAVQLGQKFPKDSLEE